MRGIPIGTLTFVLCRLRERKEKRLIGYFNAGIASLTALRDLSPQTFRSAGASWPWKADKEESTFADF